MPAENNYFDFHISEFNWLKQEILQNDRAKNQIEILSFVAVALLHWFIMTSHKFSEESIKVILFFLPSIITVFGYFWSRSFVWRSIQIGNYIMKIEKSIALDGLGWESEIDSFRGRKRFYHFDLPIQAAWVSCFSLSLLMAFFYMAL